MSRLSYHGASQSLLLIINDLKSPPCYPLSSAVFRLHVKTINDNFIFKVPNSIDMSSINTEITYRKR